MRRPLIKQVGDIEQCTQSIHPIQCVPTGWGIAEIQVECSPGGNGCIRQRAAEGIETAPRGISTRMMYRRAAGPASAVPPSSSAQVDSGWIARRVGDFDGIRGGSDFQSIVDYVRQLDVGIQIAGGQRKALYGSRVDSARVSGSQVCLSLINNRTNIRDRLRAGSRAGRRAADES